ncbi:hypothetical protein MASR2M70_17840 [Bacillota bacterium]
MALCYKQLKQTKENLAALPSKYRGNKPETGICGVYEQAMGRSAVNG